MTVSPYVLAMRARIGNELLQLPSVSAVVVDRDGRFLLSRATETSPWSLVGGAVEVGEDPRDAVVREVGEELGVGCEVIRVIDSFGGDDLLTTYPNGDVVSYVATAYLCSLERNPVDISLEATDGELFAIGWFSPTEIAEIDRKRYVDRVVAAVLG